MKQMGKRIMSLLLVMILILGAVPGYAQAADCTHETQTQEATYRGDETHIVEKVCADCGERILTGEAFTVDFMADVKRLAQQPFWNKLQTARYYNPQKGMYENVPEARYFGYDASGAQRTAAEELNTWLGENCNWRFANIGSIASDSKRLTLNAGDSLQWGLRLWTIYIATGNSGSQTVFYIDVPKAGTYDLTLSAFLEDGSVNYDGGNAGGTIDLYVNGTPVLQGHSFKGENEVEDLVIKDVTLTEGENAFMFYTVKDKNGMTSGYGDAGIPLRHMDFEPASSYTEECTDENDDRICDVCRGKLPASEEDLVPEGMIIADFKAAAEKMAQKSWWQQLRSAKNMATSGINHEIKGVGRHNSVGNMTTGQKSAYDEMLRWLDKNQSWNIDEEKTQLKNNDITKCVWLHTGEADWGLRLSTGLLNTDTADSRIYLTVDAKEAGTYDMELSLYREDKSLNYDGSNGGGIVSVYVNDTLVLENYETLGKNETVVLNLGKVELHEGENSVVFHCIADMKGKTHLNGADSERAVALRGMVFAKTQENTAEVPERATAVPGAKRLRVDFKKTVTEMKKQSFWEDLGTVTNMALAAPVDGLRGVGRYNDASMSRDNQAAYDKMLFWLAEHADWNIYEQETSFRGEGDARRLILNGTGTDWGIRIHTGGLNTEDNSSRAKLLIYAETGGVYDLDLAVFKQAQQPNWDGGNGGGYASVYLNDKKVLDNYFFLGENETIEIPVGQVELAAGENVLTIHFLADMKGNSAPGRADSERSAALCDLTFTPVKPTLQLVKNSAYRYDLHGVYVPDGATITEAVSSDEDVLTVQADEDGNVIFRAVGRGDAVVTVKNGSTVLQTVPVQVKNAVVQTQYITMTEGEKQTVWAQGIAATSMTHQIASSNRDAVAAAIYGGGVQLEAKNPGYSKIVLGQGGDDACVIHVLVKKYVEPVPTAKKIVVEEPICDGYTYDFTAVADGIYRLWVTMEGSAKGSISLGGKTLLEDTALQGQLSLGQLRLSKRSNTLTIAAQGEGMLAEILMVPVSQNTPVQVLQTQRAVVDLHHGYLAEETEIGQDTYKAVSVDETVATAAFNTKGELKIYGHAPGETEILVQEDDMTVCFVEVQVLPREGEFPVAQTLTMDFAATARDMAQQPWWNDLKATNFHAMKVIGHHPDGWLGYMDEKQEAAYRSMLQWLEQTSVWNFAEDLTGLANKDLLKNVTLNSGENAQYGLLFYSAKYLNAEEKSSLFFTVDAPATGVYAMELSAYHSIGSYVNVNNVCAGGIADVYLNGEKIRSAYSFSADPSRVVTVNLGLVELDEGENILQLDMLSDRFGGTGNSDRAPALRSVTFTPVQDECLQMYTKKTIELNEAYLPFDEAVSSETYQAVSRDEAVVEALIDKNGRLVLEGVGVGKTKVEVCREGSLRCTVAVEVLPYEGDLDGLGGNAVKADLSAMTVTIPATGMYAMQVQGEGKWNVAVDGKPVYTALQCRGTANLGAVTLSVGQHSLSVEGQGNLQAVTFVPLGTWKAEVGTSLYLTLTENYVAFDKDVTDLTVTCENEQIAQAFFDADHDLVITGKAVGTARVMIRDGNKDIPLMVQVVRPTKLKEILYTLDGFEAATLQAGAVAEGTVTGVMESGAVAAEKQLRLSGGVYFTSSDPSVATVDQTNGDVTCVGEGEAILTAYVLLDGVTRKTQAALVVTDDTDLEALSVKAEASYLGVGNTMTLTVQGVKSSGVKADMALYPVVWTVSDEAIASITEDGRLTGRSVGTVTVTATAGVQRRAVVGELDIAVVDSSELQTGDLYLDFCNERVNNLKTATLEHDGMELNRAMTHAEGTGFGYQNANGISVKLPEGESFVLDFVVKRSGWYRLEVTGTGQLAGGNNNYFIDDTAYMGHVDFSEGTIGLPWSKEEQLNTIWLDAGVHFIRMQAVTAGTNELGWYRLHAVNDPGQMQMEMPLQSVLLPGQTVSVQPQLRDENGSRMMLLYRGRTPDFTNFYQLSTSDASVISVSGATLTAQKPGEAIITVTAQVNGEELTKQLPVTVEAGTVLSAALTAEKTTFRPGAEAVPVTFTALDTKGIAVELTDVTYTTTDAEVAFVEEGSLVIGTKTGSAKITAEATDAGRPITAELWITVTTGKTEPTLYTMEKRAVAQENVLKYDWAWNAKEKAVRLADYYVEHLDLIYNTWIREGLPRNTQVGFESDANYRNCRYCGVDLVGIYSHYPWIVDPIENPWKITCPVCSRDFPSNDFESYYKSGLDERGYFHAELADEQYLVNELYPEMGDGWGVDDGWGYKGDDGTHTYINYYLQVVFRSMSSKHGMNDILPALAEAYLYTGDEKYGSAGAILTDRMADIYPEYDYGLYSIADYANADGGNGCGRIMGAIWEADHIGPVLAQAVDAFWPAMDNPDVIEYLQKQAAFKGVAPEEITPEYVRENATNNILLELKKALEERDCYGNFGMHQEVAATVAVVLDRQPESRQLIDWMYETSVVTGTVNNFRNSGGDVHRMLVEDVCRDGFGYEVSYLYNSLWPLNLINAAEALADYEGADGVSLWQNQKYINMFSAMARLSVCGRLMAQTGEAGAVQSLSFNVVPEDLITAFVRTGNAEIARCLYYANGNTVDGLHADIFTKDPESSLRTQIQQLINEHGEFDASDSNMMSGFGIAILREGPAKYLQGVNDSRFSDFWMYFGRSGGTGHEKYDALAIDFDAFGIGMSSTMGYPMRVVGGDPEREQWVRNTTSHNTVVVNDQGQTKTYGGFPMHFADDGHVKIMDAENADAYPETDIYRRTLVAVAAENGTHYAVDFFRVLGGSEHVYSFHAAGNTDPATEGLDLVEQPMGTYAGADVPYGAYIEDGVDGSRESRNGGYSWLKDVWRDNSPERTFTLDWKIEDFHNRLTTTNGIGLRLTMLSEEPMTEVAIADAVPPQNGSNPDHLEYALVRRSGADGMDTLFTAIIEPYQNTPLIADAQLVPVELVSGTETVTDRAAAIKLTLTGGRVDYVIYATNPTCTYLVDETIRFRGFAGVCSFEDGRLTYAWGSEATVVADVIDDALPAVTGRVLSFTEGIADRYTLTVSMDSPVSEDVLTDRYVFVANDGERNGAYRIYGAEVEGNTAVLDLYSQTLVRKYVDNLNLDLGFVHNIAVGQTYTIPMTETFDTGALFGNVKDQVTKAGSKLNLLVGAAGSGVSYEAHGLVAGMKFNSANGLLTWTPAKAQAGKYPITVKAVRDGEVIGEVSFVIYAVAYSGSSYSADVCTHAKAVTYDDTIVCPACATITKKSADEPELFDVAGSNMTLGNELKLNILVEAEKLGEGEYVAKITHNGETVEKTLERYNSAYFYAPYSVSAKQMSDVISVEIFKDGAAVSNVYETSVRTYAMNILNNGRLGLDVKTLVVDMLNYGAEAQKFFGYNVSDLANVRLNAAQKDLATGTVECRNLQVKGKNFYGSNVSLEDRIILNLFFKNCEAGMSATVTYTDYSGMAVSVDARLVQYKNDIYKVVVDEIVLADAFSPVTVTVYKDGAEFGSATDSIESYVARTGDSAINEAIMKFAYSARSYLG